VSLRVVWCPGALRYWDRYLSMAQKLTVERAIYGYAERGAGRVYWSRPTIGCRQGTTAPPSASTMSPASCT